MTVLVTGGLGFIGSKVVIQLLKRDIDVLVTDLNIEKNKDKLEKNILKIGKNKDKVKYQKLDITDLNSQVGFMIFDKRYNFVFKYKSLVMDSNKRVKKGVSCERGAKTGPRPRCHFPM